MCLTSTGHLHPFGLSIGIGFSVYPGSSQKSALGLHFYSKTCKIVDKTKFETKQHNWSNYVVQSIYGRISVNKTYAIFTICCIYSIFHYKNQGFQKHILRSEQNRGFTTKQHLFREHILYNHRLPRLRFKLSQLSDKRHWPLHYGVLTVHSTLN